ncbi:hypothetical protein RIF29_39980 [Crotalaria pallida]|uniref:Uncharacterized protein n=1 Tax=Crotalaria pallida TaxID=3830 RepID=A0AAN9HN06_CROPI
MLVKRPIRRKDSIRSNLASNNAAPSLSNGNMRKAGVMVNKTRYAALDNEEEESDINVEIDSIEAREDIAEEQIPIPNKAGPSTKNKIVAQKPEKIRNVLGGKESKSSIIVELPAENKTIELGREKRVNLKAEEEENRRRMKLYQQINGYKGDDFMAHVVLPSNETIDYVKQKANIFKEHFALSEPPDCSSNMSMENTHNSLTTVELVSSSAGENEKMQLLDGSLSSGSNTIYYLGLGPGDIFYH